MRADLANAILGKDTLTREPAAVPWNLGEPVYVRELTAKQKDDYVARIMPDGSTFQWHPNTTAEIVVMTLVTEDGTRIFDDDQAEELGSKTSASVIDSLFQQAIRLSGMNNQGVEAIEAHLAAAQNGAFVSD